MKEYWVSDGIIMVDLDEDGIAELRHFIKIGNKVWLNEETDINPFSVICPILLSNQFYGLSIADITSDVQYTKSTLWRQMLNNLYLTNNPQKAVIEGQVNIDDLLNATPGGVIRLKNPNAIVPIQVPSVTAQAFPILEYMDSVQAKRTGVSDAQQGLNPDILSNVTAAAVAAMTQASTGKLELIARIFAGSMFIDAATKRNLALTHSMKDSGREGTLLWTLDETLTPMGGSMLRNALLRPLTDSLQIQSRLNALDHLIEDFELLETLRTGLRKVQDLERLASRVSSGRANGRDLIAIKISLTELPRIKKTLFSSGEPSLKSLSENLAEATLLRDLIGKSIVDTPPLSIRDGGIIREKFNAEIDDLRTVSTKGKDVIAEMEARERKRTGINSLKVGYNKVFGYCIEVTKTNLDMVPEAYIRKQITELSAGRTD